MKRSDFKYTAFISYRHVEPDATIAAELHKAIETFKVPKEFYDEGKPPNFRVFRDREELSASDLSDSIQEALKESYFLIVISSKRTPLSEWCTREVELFRRLHGDDRIISVLIEGEPHEAFSQPLKELQKTIIDEAGEERTEPRELLAADLRPEEIKGDFVGYEALQASDPALANQYKKAALKLLKTEIYRIMAAILGCTYGDLKQRAKERRQKQIVRISAFFAALFLAFGLFMFNAYRQENIARREALQTNSTLLLGRSQELLDEGDKVKALLVAKEAMNSLDNRMDRFSTLKSQHEGILSEALFPVSSSIRTKLSTGNSLTYMALSPDGTLVAAGMDNDSVGLFDAVNGSLVARLSGHKEQVKLVNFSTDGKYLLSAGFDDQVFLWDVSTKELVRQMEHPGNPMMARFYGPEEFLLAVADERFMLYRSTDLGETVESVEIDPRTIDLKYDPKAQEFLELANPSAGDQLRRYSFATGEWGKNLPLPEADPEEIHRFSGVQFSRDNASLYLRRGGTVYKIDRADGRVEFEINNAYFGQELLLEENHDGTILFLVDNSIVEERDTTTGELLSEMHYSEGLIRDLVYHPATNTLALTLDTDKVALWRDGAVIDSGVSLPGAQVREMIFSPEGDRVYGNAQALKEIFVLDVASRSPEEPIASQVISTSPLGSLSLMFDSQHFGLWDNKAKGLKQEIPKDILNYPGVYVFDSYDFALSEDGRYIAYHEYVIENDQRLDSLQLIDLTTGEVMAIELDYLVNPEDVRLLFHPESNDLILASPGKVAAYSINGELQWEVIPRGLVRGLIMSQTGERLGLNYFEGNAQVLDLTNQTFVQDVPGQILWLDESLVRGIYNRSAYQSEGEDIRYHDLPADLDQTAISSADRQIYHEPSDQLLIIRNGLDKPTAYLIRFSSGELLRKFSLPLTTSTYQAKAFFQQDGELVMDQSFHSTMGSSDRPDSLRTFPQSLRFHFEDYEKMLEQQADFLGQRQLSEPEKQELGLD